MNFNHAISVVIVIAVLAATVAVAEDTGRIEGRITVEDGRGHGGVAVLLQELSRATLSDNNGTFTFADVPAGTYTVVLTHRDQVLNKTIIIVAGQTAQMEIETDWDLTFAVLLAHPDRDVVKAASEEVLAEVVLALLGVGQIAIARVKALGKEY